MFSITSGADLTMIRNRVGLCPADLVIAFSASLRSPNKTPGYFWDVNDAGQLWFTLLAMTYGVGAIYANGWSVPRLPILTKVRQRRLVLWSNGQKLVFWRLEDTESVRMLLRRLELHMPQL